MRLIPQSRGDCLVRLIPQSRCSAQCTVSGIVRPSTPHPHPLPPPPLTLPPPSPSGRSVFASITEERPQRATMKPVHQQFLQTLRLLLQPPNKKLCCKMFDQVIALSGKCVAAERCRRQLGDRSVSFPPDHGDPGSVTHWDRPLLPARGRLKETGSRGL